ncbi:allantoicase [Powellomyces hirtus]|uniref:Allantoicase n=1 Tax=Powellomyces hirtus TaxID=109895 RepID=A0A507DYU6_9FUNG|nr:allantoicase [Powellomyces hirtus]
MDGWETRRKRSAGHDWCIIKLGLPGTIKGFAIDTAFFHGESEDLPLVRRSELGSCCTERELAAAEAVGSGKWEELVAYTPLAPGYEKSRYHFVTSLNETTRFTHLRVNYYPDGGVARFRTFGLVSKDWSAKPENQIVDLAHVENGPLRRLAVAQEAFQMHITGILVTSLLQVALLQWLEGGRRLVILTDPEYMSPIRRAFNALNDTFLVKRERRGG